MSATAHRAGTASGTATGHPQFENFREVFSRHAAGVAIITARHGGVPVGFTATSVSSLSSEPPSLTFNMARTSSSWPVIEEASHIGVHVLGAGNHPLARLFATSGADRFADAPWRLGPHGVPVLDDVPGWLVVEITHRVPVGANTIVVGTVAEGRYEEAGAPLLYHRGRYGALDPIDYEI